MIEGEFKKRIYIYRERSWTGVCRGMGLRKGGDRSLSFVEIGIGIGSEKSEQVFVEEWDS